MVSTRIPSRLVVVIVAAVSWFVVGCSKSNTVTGLMATATPIPATPTPTQLANVHGFVRGKDSSGITVGIASVMVTIQGHINLSAVPSSGEYEIDNLSSGVALVTVQEGFCPNCCVCHAPYSAQITLSPGLNQYDIDLGDYTPH